MFSYLIPPFIQQVFTDNIITNKNPEWFTPLIIIYILLFVLELTVWLFMNVRRRREFSRMNLLASARYVSSLLRLPMSIIDRFSAGELVARYASILKTTKVIDMFFASMILCVRPLICSWLLMMYSWKLGLVVVVSTLMLATVMLRTAEKLKQKAKSTEVTDARLQGVTMTGLKNMETIKSMGGEWVFYEQWEHAFANALNARVRSTMSMMGVGAIPLMVTGIKHHLPYQQHRKISTATLPIARRHGASGGGEQHRQGICRHGDTRRERPARKNQTER